MNSIINSFSKTAIIRAIILGTLCVLTIAWPDLLINGAMVYVIAGYLLLCGALGIVETAIRKTVPITSWEIVKIALSALLVLAGALVIVYHRYLLGFLPLFLGGVMGAAGVVYFILALSRKTQMRPLLVALSIAIVGGGVITAVYSFGFGGVEPLSHIWGALLLLSGAYEIIHYLGRRKLAQKGA